MTQVFKPHCAGYGLDTLPSNRRLLRHDPVGGLLDGIDVELLHGHHRLQSPLRTATREREVKFSASETLEIRG